MKLLRAGKQKLEFQLAKREKRLLFRLLSLYPCIPPAHHRLSQSRPPPDAESAQQLLNEALQEQRTENRRQLESLLKDPARLRETESAWTLSLSTAEVEWLLQILNDIRVGSWITLGCPEQSRETLNEQTAPHLWAMELSGYFQVQLLQAVQG